MPVLDLRDFTGGLNVRDSLEALRPNETPDALNMTLTTNGAVRPRNGCRQAVTLPSGYARYLYYSAVLDAWFLQVENVVYIRPGDLSGSWVAHVTYPVGPTANDRIAMCDFGTLAVIAHTDQIITTDGTTATTRSIVAKGAAVALYKNRAWVCGDTGSRQTRLWFSGLGDPTTWTTASDFVDIAEKDGEQLQTLAVSGGGLLVFKRRSAYRVTDASTGAYQMIDRASGAIAPRAIAVLRGLVYTWGTDGIYAWTGAGNGVPVADRLRPRFAQDPTSEETLIFNVYGTTYRDRVIFAYPFNSGANNRLLEISPVILGRSDQLPSSAWIMEHALAQAGEDEPVALRELVDNELFAAINDGDVLYAMFDRHTRRRRRRSIHVVLQDAAADTREVEPAGADPRLRQGGRGEHVDERVPHLQ